MKSVKSRSKINEDKKFKHDRILETAAGARLRLTANCRFVEAEITVNKLMSIE